MTDLRLSCLQSLLWLGALAVLLAGGALLGPARAQDKDRLSEIERALAEDQATVRVLERKAAALKAELQDLQSDMIATARQSQDLEEALSTREAKLAELERQNAAMRDQLLHQHGKLAQTLAALQLIALRPPDTLVAAPGAPIDAARSALLLSYAVPALESRAADLRGELAGLETLRKEIALERDSLRVDQAALELEQARMADLVARKRSLEATTAAQRDITRNRSATRAAEAKSLRDLLVRLEREADARRAEALRQQAEAEHLKAERQAAALAAQQAAEQQAAEQQAAEQQAEAATAALQADQGERPRNVRRFPASASVAQLVMPARGRVVLRYGEVDAGAGEVSRGLSIETRGSAQVVAPFDGQVAYAGPFRGYGRILIIEHGGRYHTLLAGLERVDAVEGQWVLAGEPVGVMGSMAGSAPVLYLELRRTGQPINPLPWFANTNDKVQG